MAIDRLRLTTIRAPEPRFFSVVNRDLQRPRDQRLFEVRFHYGEVAVQQDTPCQITSSKRTYPFFFLNLNFSAQGKMIQPKQILELNPNNLSKGLGDLGELIDFIWGSDPGDFDISRIDLNADIELPVEYFFRTLRIPLKRKSSEFTKIQPDPKSSHSDRGLMTFYIGRSPALLRVYDKRQELKQQRKDVSTIPAIFTRLEWELRHKKCPVKRLSELFEIEHFRPFDSLQILEESDTIYDFHNDPKNSRKKFLFESLNKQWGVHEAMRIMSYGGNFKRDCAGLIFDNAAVKERLQCSYMAGVERFLGNRGPELDPLASVLW